MLDSSLKSSIDADCVHVLCFFCFFSCFVFFFFFFFFGNVSVFVFEVGLMEIHRTTGFTGEKSMSVYNF